MDALPWRKKKTPSEPNGTKKRHSSSGENETILIKSLFFLLLFSQTCFSMVTTEANSLAEALETFVDYTEHKENRAKGGGSGGGVHPFSPLLLPLLLLLLLLLLCSRAKDKVGLWVNSPGKGGAEWSRRSEAHSCRELSALLYLPGRKERPSCCL